MRHGVTLSPSDTDIFEMQRQIRLSIRLCQKGGRLPIIRAVCRLTKGAAANLYAQVNGKQANSGMMPYDEDWVMMSPVHCLHASVFCNAFLGLMAAHGGQGGTEMSKAEMYVDAHDIYVGTVGGVAPGEPLLDINRAWQLTQQLAVGSIALLDCGGCGISYATLANIPDLLQKCPICQAKYLQGKSKWHGGVSWRT